jgi:pimeloyl-ACP methyl ester carboxylesterase
MIDRVAEAVAATGLSEQARRDDPRLHGLMRALIAGNDGRAYAESALATAAASMADLERISCPMLAFCGSEDAVTPVGAAEEIAEAAPHGIFATVPGAAHWCMLEAPEATNEILFGFLEEAGPAS